MITILLATFAIDQAVKPSFTMILVAGNQNRISGTRSLSRPSEDKVIAAVQKLMDRSEKADLHWVVVDGSNIRDPYPQPTRPQISVVASKLDVTSSENPQVKSTTKVQQIFEAMSGNGKMLGMSSSLPNEESRRYFAINLAPMNVEKPLMITNVGAFRRISSDEPLDNSENFRNSIGITRQSVSEMKDWQREFTGKFHPTMILCASGEPQKGGNGMLAFPDSSTILTYQVTFNKQWSAELKDIIRVQ